MHVDIDKEYATLRSASYLYTRGQCVIANARMQGTRNGALYPNYPFVQKSPPFQKITNPLHFVKNGFDGFLGYLNRLWSAMSQDSTQVRELEAMYKELQEKSTKTIQDLKIKSVDLSIDLTKQKVDTIEKLAKILRVTKNYVSLQNSSCNMHH